MLRNDDQQTRMFGAVRLQESSLGLSITSQCTCLDLQDGVVMKVVGV